MNTIDEGPELKFTEGGFLENWEEFDRWALCNVPEWRAVSTQMRGRSLAERAILMAALLCKINQHQKNIMIEWQLKTPDNDRLLLLNKIKSQEIQKLTAEFAQITGLLKASRDALHELRCYDAEFYERTCPGLIPAIDTHL